LTKIGYDQVNSSFFDTIKIECADIEGIRTTANQEGVNLRYFEDNAHVGISIDETTTLDDIELLLNIFCKHKVGAVIDRNFLY
jgi:glycine dehydrogenase